MPNNSPPGLRTAANVPPVDSLCPARTLESLHQYPRRPGTLGRTLRPLRPCRRDFFPQSRALGIDQSSLSPGFLRKVIMPRHAVAPFSSMPMTSALSCPASTSAPSRSKPVHKIGQERVDELGSTVERFKQLLWPRSSPCPKALPLPGGRRDDRRRTLPDALPTSRSADANPVRHGRRSGVGCGRGPGDHPSYDHPGRDGRSGESDALA